MHKAQPEMKVALQSGDVAEPRDQAAALEIPLFDKRNLEPQLAWIKANTLAPTTLAVGPVMDANHWLERRA